MRIQMSADGSGRRRGSGAAGGGQGEGATGMHVPTLLYSHLLVPLTNSRESRLTFPCPYVRSLYRKLIFLTNPPPHEPA